ncbi:MAG: 50S ribosome-binding protein YggL [Pirellulales bacterium]
MKKRLRKKLRKGEFKEVGCEVRIKLAEGLSDEQAEAFVDAFLAEVIEAQGLQFGGGAFRGECDGYIGKYRGSVTVAHQGEVGRWLAGRAEVVSHEFGPLKDAWYGV